MVLVSGVQHDLIFVYTVRLPSQISTCVIHFLLKWEVLKSTLLVTIKYTVQCC